MTHNEIVESPGPYRGSHVVLLGAGASRAAFPQGDEVSRPIPLMNELVKTLNLGPILKRSGLAQSKDFEAIYSELACNPCHDRAKREIEQKIESYFSSLCLPSHVTLYDRILLELRPEDAVFTFNWDPFLFDYYVRNFGK